MENLAVPGDDSFLQKKAEEIATKFAEEDACRPNQLLPKRALFERYLQEVAQAFDAQGKQQENGASKLSEALAELAAESPELFTQEVAEAIERIANLSVVAEQDRESFDEQVARGVTLQEIAQVDDATMDLLYQAAMRLYKQKRLDDACDAFTYLTGLNPKKYRFWLALGYSEYLRMKYEEALYAYGEAYKVNPYDPMCQIASSRCYKQIGELDNAARTLDSALLLIDGMPEYESLRADLEKEKMRLEQMQHH